MHEINIHGAPKTVSEDPESINNKLQRVLAYFKIHLKPRLARRHNKLGVVEPKIAVIRLRIQRLILDSERVHEKSMNPTQTVTIEELTSHAIHLTNSFYGSRKVSLF